MTDAATFEYSDRVAPLLTYGDCQQMGQEQWPDYVGELGLTTADEPELIRMALDAQLHQMGSDRVEVWAPVHAWRTLGQLRSEAAITPLLALFERNDDDWVLFELPRVYGMVGPAAIPALTAYLEDATQDAWRRTIAADSLVHIAKNHPESRDVCVATLMQQLEVATNDTDLISLVIASLLDLKAVEAAPAIERAFATERVDEMLVGSWPSVQVELGLKQESDFSAAELKPKFSPDLAKAAELLESLAVFNTPAQKPQGFGTGAASKPKKGKKKK